MATRSFSPRVKRYRVGLSRPEAERWAPVVRREASAARTLVHASLATLPRALRGPGAHVLWSLYRALGGPWAGEVRAWAAAVGLPPAKLCLANCSYELAQGAEWCAVTRNASWIGPQRGGPLHLRERCELNPCATRIPRGPQPPSTHRSHRPPASTSPCTSS